MIRLAHPEFGEAELSAIAAMLRSGYLVQGEYVRQFEQRVAETVGCRHAIAVSSGTAALHLAVLALGLGPGDEVIVPAFTWPGCGNVVKLVGATPVLVDIDLATWNLDGTLLRSVLSPRTRAIMPVHLFGLPADLEPVHELARERNLFVIEDAACALGAEYHGRPCGSLGDVGCFSFHPRKVLTTGEGGMLTTEDDRLAERLRSLRNHGMMTQSGGVQFELAGLNYRLTELQGALGVYQMERLPEFLARRRALAALYQRALADCPGVRCPVQPVGCLHAWQAFVVLLDEVLDRSRIQEELRARGIENAIGTYSLSGQPAFADCRMPCPNAQRAQRQSLCLPLHPRLSDADVRQVAEALRGIIAQG